MAIHTSNHPSIEITPLGAGQDVGRSCIIVKISGKTIMFDCGMHMGYDDHRKFPDFSFLSPIVRRTVVEANESNKSQEVKLLPGVRRQQHRGKYKKSNKKPVKTMHTYDNVVDAVILSHFHLDHSGALPYFTEVCGYHGPLLMTYPTKAISQILLRDFRRISSDRNKRNMEPYEYSDNVPFEMYTLEDISNCMKKVTTLNLHQRYVLDDTLEIIPYYAGHVLGAAMFYVRCLKTGASVLYTGDYNMTPDRHLGAANIQKLRPSVLITESTYATIVRDSKATRERQFLDAVHKAVKRGGKVLIPVFALGRAQELCILIETYWERMDLKVPIYFSAGLVQRANYYYKLFIHWTNEKIKHTFGDRNMFDFKHIKPFERSRIKENGPMVLFATPGMLHAGMSLEVFKHWCPDPKNLAIFPGYCVAGTMGNMVLTKRKGIIEHNGVRLNVQCEIKKISFSAHADTKGIFQLIRQCQPKHIVLVHGNHNRMVKIAPVIKHTFNKDPQFPANGQTISLPVDMPNINVPISSMLLHDTFQFGKQPSRLAGVLLQDKAETRLVHPKEAAKSLGIQLHTVQYVVSFDYSDQLLTSLLAAFPFKTLSETEYTFKTVKIVVEPKKLLCYWKEDDQQLGVQVQSFIHQFGNDEKVKPIS